jgi:hypothetical protein
MAPEPITKAKESLTNPCQPSHHRVGSRLFLTPSGAVPLIFNLAVPCLLIKRVLSLLIYQNQSDKSDKVELAPKVNKPSARLIKPVLAVFLYDFRLLIPAVILVNYRKGETFVLLGSVLTTKLLLVNSATYWRLTLLLLIFVRILTVPLVGPWGRSSGYPCSLACPP